MFINAFASGSNVQRIAKNAGGRKIHGYIDAAYTQVEQTCDDAVKRKYFMLRFDGLRQALKNSELDENTAFTSDNHPNWSAIWGAPLKCKDFLSTTFKAIVGEDDHLASLNISEAAGEEINSYMIWTSANNKQLLQFQKILKKLLPHYRIVVLNGDAGVTNFDADTEVKNQIKYAKDDGQVGIIVLSKYMGSRSFSVSEIQCCIEMYDGGSVDASTQKAGRNLTGGLNWDGDNKDVGITCAFSYDGNRSATIENLILYEAITLARATGDSFNNAVRSVVMSVNPHRIDVNGNPKIVPVDELVEIFSEDENILKVADVTYDIEALINSAAFDILSNIKTTTKGSKKKFAKLAPNRTGGATGAENNTTIGEKDIKQIEKLINEAIRTINRSATTVYNIANDGNDYRECLNVIANDAELTSEFIEFYTVHPMDVLQLVDEEILNVMLLDIVVEHSKQTPEWFV